MKTKILFLIYVAIFGGLAYFVYPIFTERYIDSSAENESEKSSLMEKKNSSDSSIDQDDDSEDLPDESTVSDDVFIEIDAEDCEESCEHFEDADDKKYCQEYCGLNNEVAPSNSPEDCEKMEDLEKDYCYKNQAITKKDFTLCKKIADKKIFEACKTRLTEDLMNSTNTID